MFCGESRFLSTLVLKFSPASVSIFCCCLNLLNVRQSDFLILSLSFISCFPTEEALSFCLLVCHISVHSFYSKGHNLLLFCCSDCPRCGPEPSGARSPSGQLLCASDLSCRVLVSGHTLSTSYFLSPGSSHFAREPWSPLVEDGLWGPRSGSGCAHCFKALSRQGGTCAHARTHAAVCPHGHTSTHASQLAAQAPSPLRVFGPAGGAASRLCAD